MQALVFGFEMKEIIHVFVLRIDPSCDLVGPAKSFCPMEFVVCKKKPKRNGLHGNKCQESKVTADEKKYVAHQEQGSVFTA